MGSRKSRKKILSTKKSTVGQPEPQIQTQTVDLNAKLLIVRVGSDETPASDDDISEVKNDLTALFDENNITNCIVYVTHQRIEIDSVDVSSGPE